MGQLLQVVKRNSKGRRFVLPIIVKQLRIQQNNKRHLLVLGVGGLGLFVVAGIFFYIYTDNACNI